jgi:hypothetical protein
VTPKTSDAREAKGKRNNDLLREEESVVDEEIAGIPQKVIRACNTLVEAKVEVSFSHLK